MTTHTLKAKTLRQELGITCDGCSIHAAAKTFIRAVGDGLIIEVTPPPGWSSKLLSAPENGADGEIITRDLCPTCVAAGVKP